MASESLTLVVNPGSASRKYALFNDSQLRASIHFEFVDNNVAGKIDYLGIQQDIDCSGMDLNQAASRVVSIFIDHGVVRSVTDVAVIGIRLVAPSHKFMRDELITPAIESLLEQVEQIAPLHVSTVLSEIRQLKEAMLDTPIIAISDSAFHESKPIKAWSYGIDVDLANRLDIKRYGYHGISVGSVVKRMENDGTLMPKTIVCHLGSGSSVTAVNNGESYDNTMGYTPLEGLIMASRSGSIDVAAALTIKRDLRLSDEELEKYLNSKCGLLGVSGSSNDIRQLIDSEEKGDERASLALELYVYRVQQAIGQMVASMGGVDCLVFTATVGERSNIIRSRIIERLGYLGLEHDQTINEQIYEPVVIANIATNSSKPIYVISTDESVEIANRAEYFLQNLVK